MDPYSTIHLLIRSFLIEPKNPFITLIKTTHSPIQQTILKAMPNTQHFLWISLMKHHRNSHINDQYHNAH
jgi:hypothetical protein